MICVKCNAHIKEGRLLKHFNIKCLNCGASYIHKNVIEQEVGYYLVLGNFFI